MVINFPNLAYRILLNFSFFKARYRQVNVKSRVPVSTHIRRCINNNITNVAHLNISEFIKNLVK